MLVGRYCNSFINKIEAIYIYIYISYRYISRSVQAMSTTSDAEATRRRVRRLFAGRRCNVSWCRWCSNGLSAARQSGQLSVTSLSTHDAHVEPACPHVNRREMMLVDCSKQTQHSSGRGSAFWMQLTARQTGEAKERDMLWRVLIVLIYDNWLQDYKCRLQDYKCRLQVSSFISKNFRRMYWFLWPLSRTVLPYINT